MNISANISLLFKEYPLLKRIEAASNAGFKGIEIQFPYSENREGLQRATEDSEIPLVMFNVAAGDLMEGGEGLAAVPEHPDAFRHAVEASLFYAETLKPTAINILPGRCSNAKQRERYYDTLLSNIDWCNDQLKSNGIITLVEAINNDDMPDSLICDGEQLHTVIADLNLSNVKMQYDLYHMGKMNQPIKEQINNYISMIGHVQFADTLNRNQPGTGDLDVISYLSQLNDLGYQGWAGAEYHPTEHTNDSLEWLSAAQAIGS